MAMSAQEESGFLLIDSSPEAPAIVKIVEKNFKADIDLAQDAASARRLLSEGGYSVVLLDLNLPDGALDLLSEICSAADHPQVIMLAEKGSHRTASKALRLGASDYLVKDDSLPVYLPKAIEDALRTLSVERAKREKAESAAF